MRRIQGMTDYEFQRKDSELVHSELVRLCGEQRNRIAELEAADAEDNLCLRTAIERNAELEAELSDERAWNARRRGVCDRIGTALLPFRELRNTGEPANNDAIEVERLCIRVKQAEKKNAELEAEVARLKKLVSAQAEDAGLWFDAETAPEAYLQQELRKLHAAIEGEQENKQT